MERRIVIYCFYNKNGIVDDSVKTVLSQLRTIADYIVFVVNGIILNREIIEEYIDVLIIRENYGFDFGAYRTAIQKIDDIYAYDELIFCNDTFFGFFVPLNAIIEEMRDKQYEVWGLNRVNRGILEHIQSYFLVFKKSVFKDLTVYFLNSPMVATFAEDVAYMEPRLFRYLNNRGYSIGSYTDTALNDIYSKPLECIRDYKLPILKKKSFREDYCNRCELNAAISYVEANSLYKSKIDKVDNFVSGTTALMRILSKSRITEEELLNWARKGKFYIFGAGVVANELYYTYFEDERYFKGYIVSEKENGKDYVHSISEIQPNARIIIGVRPELQKEVYSLLPESMEKLLLWEI